MRLATIPILLALLVACQRPLHSAPDAGEPQFWQGHLGPEDPLPLSLHIGNGSAAVDFPTLGQAGYRGSVTAAENAWSASVPTPSGPLKLDGKRKGNRIEGGWTFLGRTGTFRLARTEPPLRGWREEQVRFTSADGTPLSGSLLLPLKKGPHPVFVGVHGSGAETRAGANRFLAERLAAGGAAILLFDKRGTGGSGGDWRQATLQQLADDVEAGLGLLTARPAADRCRTGLLGASQAAWVSAIVAGRRPDLRYLMMRSGVVTGVAEEGQFDYLHRLRGEPDAVIAAARRILDLDDMLTRTGRGWEDLQSEIRVHANKRWFKTMDFKPLAPAHPARLSYRQWIDFDPLPLLRSHAAEGLWVFGGSDDTIPAERSAAILRSLAGSGLRHEVVTIAGAWHSLHYPPAAGQKWPRLSPESVAATLDWYRRTVVAAARRARCTARSG